MHQIKASQAKFDEYGITKKYAGKDKQSKTDDRRAKYCSKRSTTSSVKSGNSGSKTFQAPPRATSLFAATTSRSPAAFNPTSASVPWIRP